MPAKKSILTPAKRFISNNKNDIKLILFFLLSLPIIYWMIVLFTPKPQMPAEYKLQLDILNKANQDLIAKQQRIDSTIAIYQGKIQDIDFKINNIKEKTTIIREYYREKSKEVNAYTPTQIDSFFKQRYNY